MGLGRGQMGIILEYHMQLYVDPAYILHLYIPSTLLLMTKLKLTLTTVSILLAIILNSTRGGYMIQLTY
jgi:hypothetical protein